MNDHSSISPTSLPSFLLKKPNFSSSWQEIVPEITSTCSDHDAVQYLAQFSGQFLIGPVRIGKCDPKPFDTPIYFASSIPNSPLLMVRKCFPSEFVEKGAEGISANSSVLSLPALKCKNVQFLVSTESSLLEAFLNKKRVHLGLLIPSKLLRGLLQECISSLYKQQNHTGLNIIGLRELAYIHLIWTLPQMKFQALSNSISSFGVSHFPIKGIFISWLLGLPTGNPYRDPTSKIFLSFH